MADGQRIRHFITEIIDQHVREGRWGPAGERSVVRTRFPPEPNGYLHIGHAKSIFLNYGLAAEYGGGFKLRFDDTNPVKEEQEYVDSIVRDVRWLGARWDGLRDGEPEAGVLFASDYFQQMNDWAVELIRKGRAYVDDLSAEQIREHRGTLTEPGRASPFRERSVAESLDLFERMKAGEFPDGAKTLRARIDMASPNLNLRDPVMYRILHADHHRAGSQWNIYPMYDWAHGLEDSLEGITHSICTLEFENHRPLYDWFIQAINEGRTHDGSGPWGRRIHHPQQIEFARLNLNYTVMSKRRLLELVKGAATPGKSDEEGKRMPPIRGWDDPRMPTISAMRRRGYTPEALRDFCERVGVAKFNGVSDLALLEHCVRDHLNQAAPRVMAVLRPLKVVITNWPDEPGAEGPRGREAEAGPSEGEQAGAPAVHGQEQAGAPAVHGRVDWLEAINNPEDPTAGVRRVPFARELYIERDDFMEDPPRKFFRLAPGREVRLRYAFFITCQEVIKDASGEVVELRCVYDPATRGGDAPDGRKAPATLHWVSAAYAIDAEVRLYDRLFTKEDPDDVNEAAGEKWTDNLNPDSLHTRTGCKLEPSWRDAAAAAEWPDGVQRVQFERQGYFCVDPDAREGGGLVFNRTTTLKDAWAKIQQRGGGAGA